MVEPFEGLLGDSSELRTIQFMLPVRDLKFNISELARETFISRQTMMRVVKKLLQWNVLRITGKYGGANYYALNFESGIVKAFEDMDNAIIDEMVGDKCQGKTSTMMDGPREADIASARGTNPGYIVGLSGETCREGWLHLCKEKDRDYCRET
ncbi:MAG TPA: hypothetical protein PLJ25_09395, partial [Methanothrix sp.]|nr:hypothetical protein [Methanothrix sp.]